MMRQYVQAQSYTYAVTVISRPGYIHSRAFDEIAEALRFALQKLGVAAVGRPEKARQIILGANLLTHVTAAAIKPDAIIFNLEQVDRASNWIDENYLHFLRAHEVWDYSRQNIALLKAQGVGNIHYVPPGYAAELDRITPQEPQDIDVLFYGSINPRRQAVLDALSNAGVKVVHAFGVYGDERDALIARSKVVLNMHFYEAKIFETARVFYLLTNGVCVVSEDGADQDEQEYRGALAFAPYNSLAQTCIELVRDPTARRAVADRGRAFMRHRPQEAFLRAVLDVKEQQP